MGSSAVGVAICQPSAYSSHWPFECQLTWNSNRIRSSRPFIAMVSGSDTADGPRYVSLEVIEDDPSSSYLKWFGKLRLGSTPSPTVISPSSLLSRRFLRHSRSTPNVYSYPSGLAT